MALLICPDCGNKVSERAENCPVCGCPVSLMLGKAEEDKEKAETITVFEQKEKTKNTKKKILVVIFVIVIVIIAGLFFAVVKINNKKSGLYEGIKWGEAFEEVAKKYPDNGNEFTKETMKYYRRYQVEEKENFLGIEGTQALLSFGFDDNGLHEVTALVITTTDTKNSSAFSGQNMQNEIYEELCKRYGECEKPYEWKCIWTTSKSEIAFMVVTDDSVYVTFEDIATAE